MAAEPTESLAVREAYCPRQAVAGELQIIGSTTMQQLAALWSDGFQRIHPETKVQIHCRGSESVLPNLSEGRQLGLMSRPLTEDEQRRLAGPEGKRVVAITVCHGALGIIVSRENAIPGLTWNPDSGLVPPSKRDSPALRWSDLGLDGEGADLPVRLHRPAPTSGSRALLEQLFPVPQGSTRETAEHASQGQLTQAVAADRTGIGLVSLSRGTSDAVRIVPIGLPGQEFVAPREEAIRARRYPLLRPLFMLLPLTDGKLDDPLLAEFTAYVLSQCGQQDAEKDGFVPLSESEWRVQEETLGWHRQQ